MAESENSNDEMAGNMDALNKKAQKRRRARPSFSQVTGIAETNANFDGAAEKNMLADLRRLLGEGEKELVTRVIEIFLEDTPGRMMNARKALEGRDMEMMGRAAHTLKGSSASLGAYRMAAMCAKLEKKARAGSFQGVENILTDLQTEFDQVRQSLESEWLQGRTSNSGGHE